MGTTSPEPNDPLAEPHQRFQQALRAGDVATLVSLQCADGVWMPPNETSVYGIEEIEEWFTEYFEHFRIPTMVDTDREVTVLDGWAVEVCAYMVSILSVKSGDRIRDDGRQLVLWKEQEDGSWKMAQVMFNSMRPVGSGTSRFLARMMADKRTPTGERALSPDLTL